MPGFRGPERGWRHRLGLVAISISVVTSVALGALPETAAAEIARGDATESILVVANGSSLSDVGTAASLIAAGTGDAVIQTESPVALGADASGVIAQQLPQRIVIVGGTAAVSEGVAGELRRIVDGVVIERLAGRDRVETAALAARRALGDRPPSAVVIANGWSLPDVGAAASAVASGIADVVLYTDRGTLGHPTRLILREQRPQQVFIVGGSAAISEGLDPVISDESAGASVLRMGGATRLQTAALIAEQAFQAGADTAVIADGWSDDDVGIAAALAAALDNSAVVFADGETLDASVQQLLSEHPPRRTLVVSTDPESEALNVHVGAIVPQAHREYIESSASASHYVLGTARPLDADIRATGYAAVHVGFGHTCAITIDKSLACWGDNLSGQSEAPSGHYTSVATVFATTCAIRIDGTIACWGAVNHPDLTNPPIGEYTDIAGGTANFCAIRVDQRIVCWGQVTGVTVAAPEGAFTDLAMGGLHTCAIRTDRAVICWGSNNYGGQLKPPRGGQYIDVAAGNSYSCALRTDRTVVCWGGYGRIISPEGKFVAISGAEFHACALSVDMTVRCWGDSDDGRASAPDGDFVDIAVGEWQSCGIKPDRSLSCWNTAHRDQWIALEGHHISIALGERQTCAIALNGELSCWNRSRSRQFSTPTGRFTEVSARADNMCAIEIDRTIQCQGVGLPYMLELPERAFTAVSVGWNHSCALSISNTVQCWSNIYEGVTITRDGRYTSVSVGWDHSCALSMDKTVQCWGEDEFGKTDAPEGAFSAVSAGIWHSCAIRTDRALQCWGDNTYGQLDVPDGEFTSLSAGKRFSCAIRTSESVECWGTGTGITVDVLDGRFASVEVGPFRACGIRVAHTTVCWGWFALTPADVEEAE